MENQLDDVYFILKKWCRAHFKNSLGKSATMVAQVRALHPGGTKIPFVQRGDLVVFTLISGGVLQWSGGVFYVLGWFLHISLSHNSLLFSGPFPLSNQLIPAVVGASGELKMSLNKPDISKVLEILNKTSRHQKISRDYSQIFVKIESFCTNLKSS